MIFSKTIIYRIYSFVVLIAIALAFTHDITTAFKVSFGLEMVKLVQYYIFEHIWKTLIKKL